MCRIINNRKVQMAILNGMDEERQLYYDLGLRINWNCISNEEWERMKQRNEQSKQLEQLNKTKEKV